jgi:hypothetical protein
MIISYYFSNDTAFVLVSTSFKECNLFGQRKAKKRWFEIVLGEEGRRREEVKRMIGTIWRPGMSPERPKE